MSGEDDVCCDAWCDVALTGGDDAVAERTRLLSRILCWEVSSNLGIEEAACIAQTVAAPTALVPDSRLAVVVEKADDRLSVQCCPFAEADCIAVRSTVGTSAGGLAGRNLEPKGI